MTRLWVRLSNKNFNEVRSKIVREIRENGGRLEAVIKGNKALKSALFIGLYEDFRILPVFECGNGYNLEFVSRGRQQVPASSACSNANQRQPRHENFSPYSGYEGG